jgi:hypothetical protein
LVSECDERKNNLVDGTNSEWWRENEAAWLEVVSNLGSKKSFQLLQTTILMTTA